MVFSMLTFSYRCEVNGVIVKEANEELPPEGLPTYDLSVTKFEVGTDEKGEGVTWYDVEAIRSSDGRMSKRSRRFKEFFDLSEDVASAFVGNHLASDLPRLPRRGVKLVSNHLDPLFIEGRRQELQNFLRGLVKIPRGNIFLR